MAYPVAPRPLFALGLVSLTLAGCGSFQGAGRYAATTDERECLARAMYFESNRSSPDGMLAVGTVVMNRLEDPRYPKTICGVVGARNQFAPGVLTQPMTSRATPKVFRVADAVLAGSRHPILGKAKFFHTAGYSFPYRNMHYVTLAGGNMFYDKRQNPTATQTMVAALAPLHRPIALAALETPIPDRPGSTFDVSPVPAAAVAAPAQTPIPDRAPVVAELRRKPLPAAPEPDETDTDGETEEPVKAAPVRVASDAVPSRRTAVAADKPAPAKAAPVRLASAPVRPEPERPSSTRGRAEPIRLASAPPARPQALAFKLAERDEPDRRPSGRPAAAAGKGAEPRVAAVAATPPARPNRKDATGYSPQAIAAMLAKYDGKKDGGGKTTRVSTLRRPSATE